MTAAEVVPMHGVTIDRVAVLRHLNLNPNDAGTQALLLVCERYGLDPLLKHMVLIQGRPYVTRDGYLHLAHQSGALDGIEVLDEGDDGQHWWARVSVFRKDMSRAFTYKGRYPKSGGNKAYGPEMAIKCAEVAALRRAFNVTGVGAADEKWDAEDLHTVEDAPALAPKTDIEDLVARVDALPQPVRDTYSAWKADQGFVWHPGYEVAAVAAMNAELDRLLEEHGARSEGSGDAGSGDAPEGLTHPSPSPDPDEPKGYECWTKDDLVAEIKKRDDALPTSGNKDRLVAELRAWDAVNGCPWEYEPEAPPF